MCNRARSCLRVPDLDGSGDDHAAEVVVGYEVHDVRVVVGTLIAVADLGGFGTHAQPDAHGAHHRFAIGRVAIDERIARAHVTRGDSGVEVGLAVAVTVVR